MQMKKARNQVRVIAERAENPRGFWIYVDFSGQRELLMFHRYNSLLYGLLKDGVGLDELARVNPAKCFPSTPYAGSTRKRRMNVLWKELAYLRAVIGAYAEERLAAGSRTGVLTCLPAPDSMDTAA